MPTCCIEQRVFIIATLIIILASCGKSNPTTPTPKPVEMTVTPTATMTMDTVESDPAMPDPTEEPPIVLIGAVIDGTGADPLPDAALVIQGEQIVALGPRAEVAIPANAQLIEAQGMTILPGFINAHVHDAYGSKLKTWARAGVTTVRDVGARLSSYSFSTRDTLNADPAHARLIAAGPLVTVPGGYPIAGNNFSSLTVDSPEDARAKIGQLIDEGAEVIKIVLTIGDFPTLSLEEATAIVETAHERGIPVTVHATTARDLERALDAGVDDIAHIVTDHVSDEQIQRMIENGVAWVPTLAIQGGHGAENLQRFLDAGGQVALGNDAGFLPGVIVGMPMNEIEQLHAAGLTPMQIIVAATRNAAKVCRVGDTLGTLEAGKQADVLVVNGDPLQDLAVLRDVQLVIHNGTIIHSRLP